MMSYLFRYQRMFLAWMKKNNQALYTMMDSKIIREKMMTIRYNRRQAWRDICLPQEGYKNFIFMNYKCSWWCINDYLYHEKFAMNNKTVPESELRHIFLLFQHVLNDDGSLRDASMAMDLIHTFITLMAADR